MRDLHGDHVGDSLELDGLTASFGIEAFLLRVTHEHSAIRAPLQDNKAVDMFAGVGACGAFIGGFTDHPACFPVTNRTCRIAGESEIGSQDKITFYFPVYKLKLIAVEPDIGARALIV